MNQPLSWYAYIQWVQHSAKDIKFIPFIHVINIYWVLISWFKLYPFKIHFLHSRQMDLLKMGIRLFLAIAPDGFPSHWVCYPNSTKACNGLALSDLWCYFISLFSSGSLSSSFHSPFSFADTQSTLPLTALSPFPASRLEFPSSGLKRAGFSPRCPQLKHHPLFGQCLNSPTQFSPSYAPNITCYSMDCTVWFCSQHPSQSKITLTVYFF